MKLLRREEKKKKSVYIIAGVLAVVFFFFWVSLPLMQRSNWDSSVTNPYGMSKKTADLALLDSGGIDAPGSPLTGALIDNPASRLELEASSLFKMPESDIKYEEANITSSNLTSSSADSNVSAPAVSYPSQPQVGVPKLNKLPSIAGSNAGTMTVGTVHNKFFGSEKAEANLVPLSLKSDDIKSSKKKLNLALAALKSAEQKSLEAQQVKTAEQSKGAAISAFDKTVRVDEGMLSSKEEKKSAESGLAFAKAETDFKKNDPSITKKKITLPKPEKDEDESKKMEEQIKMMLLKMIIQATLGSIFGAIGQSIFGAIQTSTTTK
ncbi:MAG: hypothetical protein ACP5PA_00885 [Elusimicrobiales bacterium]